MDNKDFLYFTQDDILDKIDIDDRLREPFKNVLKKIQEYFNANGYISQRDYKSFIEKYFLNSNEKNFRIIIGKDIQGLLGYYYKNGNLIHITDKNLSLGREKLEGTLCHEFIHFLVMHGLTNEEINEVNNRTFINEALTEMLNQQIYPQNNGYIPQVEMQKYANLLSGKTNNYSLFLKGKIDAAITSPMWKNYHEYTEKFQKDYDKDSNLQLLSNAIFNENYINAQRQLIQLFIQPSKSKTFEEYCDCIKKLSQRVAPDQEYVDQIVEQLDNVMIRTLNIKDEQIKNFLKQKLVETRENIKKLQEYDGKRVYEFEILGKKIAIDENLKVRGDLLGVQRGWNPNTRKMYFEVNGKRIELDVDKLNFNQRQMEIQQKIEELSTYYSPDTIKDMTMLSDAFQQIDSVESIEKFELPRINGEKSPTAIYIAKSGNKVIILNNATKVDYKSHIPLDRYIGKTSKNPNLALISSENIGYIENGIVMSTLTTKQIDKRVLGTLAKEVEKELTPEKFKIAKEKYIKNSVLIDESELKSEVISMIAKEKYDSLSTEEKEKLQSKVKAESKQFIISSKDGKIEVGLIHGKSSYKATSKTLYDSKEKGIYNNIKSNLQSSKDKSKATQFQQIPLDQKGNMIIPADKKENISQEATAKDQQQDNKSKLKKPYIKPKLKETLIEKKQLQDKQKDIRRQIYEGKIDKMGLNASQTPTLNNLFTHQQSIQHQMSNQPSLKK